jgi:large conductance mechanosensitive channel
MRKFFNEFKTFAMRGNVVDMAVGVILGGAFGKIVSSLVSDIIMPPIGVLLGGVDFTDLKITIKETVLNPDLSVLNPAVTINYGQFIQMVIDFLIIAFAIFIMIKTMNNLTKKKEKVVETPPTSPEPTREEVLLTEIRDILKNNNNSMTS